MARRRRYIPKTEHTHINPVRLGDILIEALKKGNFQTEETGRGTLKYVTVPEIGNMVAQVGITLEPPTGDVCTVNNRIVGIYGVTDTLPPHLRGSVLVHEHIEAITGNHFKAIIAEIEEARLTGVFDEVASTTTNFGLTRRTLDKLLRGELHFRALKIRGILLHKKMFLLFLAACQHPEAINDLRFFSENEITHKNLLKRGYGRAFHRIRTHEITGTIPL